MSDISLSKAVRSNLLSLQNTATMMGKTQDRLATGNKVNSALDNPTNFFTASSLNSRAGDLNSLMDSMANGIQTLEAADNGLTSITKTLESMQSTLRQARQDKSFQTQSFNLDPSVVGNGAVENLTFSDGAFGTPQQVKLHSKVISGNNGFANNGAAGEAGNVTIQAASLNSNIAVNFSFSATDTAASVAEKINNHLSSTGGTSGISAKVIDGQLSIQSSKGETITLGSTGNTARYIGLEAGNTTATAATAGPGTAVAAGALATFSFTINGESVTVPATPAGNTDAQNATAIKEAINNSAAGQKYGIQATGATNQITLTAANGADFTLAGAGLATAGLTAATTTNGVRASGTVTTLAAINEVKTTDTLVREINASDMLNTKIRASNDNGKLRIENLSTKALKIDGVNSTGDIDGNSTGASQIAGNKIRGDLASQFNELRDQLDKTSDDASFNGINLLRGDNLKITFNETGTSSIDIRTKDGEALNAASLNVFDITEEDLDSDVGIENLIANIKLALNDVRSQSGTFGSNLSIVENRQNFTKEMINTLETGAANLTLADMNEEAANLLALQTRQSLSSSSLSLASQADQSVLQLLQ
ncbi:Flagellin hook IN motif-containing protein [Devosia sp. YR412]|uniref:flagellin N-terminal helical domain-containing protein n=1 Tax=Devosia sp. YR412 TaxID=1881030 RepID=UPI0008CF5537|nr:flagellin [Devosia sp. YR412]SEP99020.1 Flagellin hook IN motif-containing protein [Devosia sp. YR412]